MPTLTPVPIEVSCSNCNTELFAMNVYIAADEETLAWSAVSHVNMVCPLCKSLITEATDDLTEFLEGIVT